jgi:hypothetical protein
MLPALAPLLASSALIIYFTGAPCLFEDLITGTFFLVAAHVKKYDDHAYSEVSEQEYVHILVQIVPPKNTDLGSSKLS